jgi:hypothetical protein
MKTEPIEIKTKLRGVTHERAGQPHPQEIIRTMLKPGTRLELRPEPDNPVDPGAVAVWYRRKALFSSSEYHLGYLGRDLARDIAILWAQGRRLTCTVLEVTGGRSDAVSLGVNVVIRG